MTAIRVVPQKFRFCLLKNKRQEFFFAPKVLSGGQTDRVLARRAVCTSDNQASMSKQGESPDYECPAEIAGARSAEQSPFAHRAEQSPFAHFANTTINSLVSYLRGAVKIYTYHQSILKRL